MKSSRPMPTSLFRHHLSRSAPAITLAAMTAIVVMFVVSSLHGCRRGEETDNVRRVSTGTAPETAETPQTSFAAAPATPEVPAPTPTPIPTRDELAESAEAPINPAEADAMAQEAADDEPEDEVVLVSPREQVEPEDEDEDEADDDIVPDMSVNKSVAGSGVEKRRPQGVSERFEANGESVWAWVSVKNPGPVSSHVWMIWKHEGTVRSRVRLDVGESPRWRTWSRFRMRATHVGQWTVETTDPDGTVLETLEFEVVAPDALATADSDLDIPE